MVAGKVESKTASKSTKMQPKSGKSKKSGKKNTSHRSALLLDGLPASEMSRDQLLNHLTRVLDQLEKEREERNFFQLERDQIYGFWKVAKDEVEDVRARFRNKEKELEDAEELRQKDNALYKQQIKFLLHEHQNTSIESQVEQLAALELAHLGHQEEEKALRHQQLLLKENIRQLNISHQGTINRLAMEHSKEMSDVRQGLEQENRQMEIQFQKRIEVLRSELESRRKDDLQEIYMKDEQHVTLLCSNHEESIINFKNYYNDVILSNMTLINSLKDQIAESRIKEEKLEKSLQASSKENKTLQEKCNQLEKINIVIEKETKNWQQMKCSLQTMKGHLKMLKKQLEEAVWNRQVLEQKLAWTQSEKNELEEHFMAAILEVQQKANLKQIVLEKKLETLEESLLIRSEHQLLSNNSKTLRKSPSFHSNGKELEQRVSAVVKLNFKSSEKNKDKSFRSSIDNIETEDRNSELNSKRNSFLESIASCSSLSVSSIRPSSNAIPCSDFSVETQKVPATHR